MRLIGINPSPAAWVHDVFSTGAGTGRVMGTLDSAAQSVAAIRNGDALLVVDLQRDFLPGGALGVAGGDEVLAVANAQIARFAAAGLPVVASRDWHPPAHCSFAAQGGTWPEHCVAGTPGAEFAPGLALPADALLVYKATHVDKDAYSAFQGTGLAGRLRELDVRRVFLVGLATDYCVLQTALDARRLGLDVVVLEDGVRAVDLSPGDGERAVDRMREAGCHIVAHAAAAT
jgi:nicotinamidase/pyrazinamidase